MQVDEQILALAQREKRACSSIVNSLETLAWSQLHSNAKEFSMVGTINCFLYIYHVIFNRACLLWNLWNLSIVHSCSRKCMCVWFRRAVHVFNHISVWNCLCNATKPIVMFKWKCQGVYLAWVTSCLQMSKNIVMEAHLIQPAHFTGITCTAHQQREVSVGNLGMETSESGHEQQLRVHCSTGAHNTSLNNFFLKVRLMYAFLHPPVLSTSLITTSYRHRQFRFNEGFWYNQHLQFGFLCDLHLF